VNITTKPSLKTKQTSPITGKIDHIRARFESMERQQELASDLDCFRPGKELSLIRFIANAHSVHVARWLALLAHTRATVEVDTVNPVPAFSNEYVSARPLLPAWLKIPMTFRYLLAGLALRFSRSRPSADIALAHCASGNGFAAWLSGQRYLIVAYGSEIFCANQRGFAYRWLLRKILQGAERIADCSPECTKVLREQFDIPSDRIYSFHLGYDEKHFRPIEHSKRMELRRDAQLPVDEPVWVVNRRTHPHYRTHEVARGFLEYCQRNVRGRLILLCGDHQADYTQSVCEIIRSHSEGHRITVVKQMLSPVEFAAWMQLSDFSISVPRTDNFSISILESMGCGTVPILANLEGYNELKSCRPVRWMAEFEPSDFTKMFAESAASWPAESGAQRNECFRFVQAGFSTENAIRDIAAFYLGVPRQKNELMKRVA